MKSTTQDNVIIPTTANDIRQGEGAPVILIHGVAASLHDWDDLIPDLSNSGYACYALDLLGHGDSPKMDSGSYRVDWLSEHFVNWVTSLRLTEPAILIGHSLGGYLALEYAQRFSAWTRCLVLVDPLYSRSQLPLLLRRTYGRTGLSKLIVSRIPEWMFRAVVDVTSVAMGHSVGGTHSLPERTRAQTALDFTRTAPGIYNVPNTVADLTPSLSSISVPTLIVWGDRDQTLSPSSFIKMVGKMPRASGRSFHTGHVPHQSNAEEFNQLVLGFLRDNVPAAITSTAH
jgi:pimeloyl-ACP methyl ester carboxylesterase